MFSKVLIANRGEIACRVIRTCQAMGVATVAIHSEADADALHVRLADEAVCVGPPPVVESYLNRSAVLAAALERGAEAIHPGYGLLSEDPAFVEMCRAASVAFVGPSPLAMLAIGHKIPARAEARAVGVPVVPGLDVHVDRTDRSHLAEQVGFPLILKANAGGGGIGMTVVDSPATLEKALSRATATARRVFGDDTVYAERFLPRARHVEVQIFGATEGALHLFHRDCSVQRRHQKVIEEAPAPRLSEALSGRLTDAALRLAESVNYENAGTIEFLVSGEDFYFLEVNARLQVEHPVTEMVTGIDLVAAQLRQAAGEPLGWHQGDVRAKGHSIEARIYAEDPVTGMPSPGRIDALEWPAGDGVRVDAGYGAGDVVTPYYDPLIAKLVVHGRDRNDALDRMSNALAACHVGGVKTNLPLLARVVANDEFRSGSYDTGILDRLTAD